MAPLVQAGLYNPKKNASATVSLNGPAVASVTILGPDADVWLANGSNAVSVLLDRKTADSYAFDASLTYPGQPNVCIPDTRGNAPSGDVEYAASSKSYATVTPGCALNPLTGRAQPGSYLLNVCVNSVALTQLSSLKRSTPDFLAAGLNVISAANAAISTDYFVRDGGTGTCTLP